MRKRLLIAAASVLVLTAAALAVWRITATPAYVSEAFGADPRATLQKELADPASVWAKAMRNPADLARFKDAPAYRVELDYDAPSHNLKGTEAILYTNTTGEALKTLYLSTPALAWGDPGLGDKNFKLTDLLADGQAVTYTQEDLYGRLDLRRPLKPGQTVVIEFGFAARVPGAKPPQGQWSMDPKEVPPTYGAYPPLGDGLSEAIPWLLTDIGPLLELEKAMVARPTYSLVDLRITTPKKWRVISSGTRVEEAGLPEGGTESRVVSASYSFMLFATSRLGEVRGEKNGVTIAVNYPAMAEAAGKAMLEDAARFVEIYDQLLGPYPFTELEILPIVPGDTFSGMNRSGMIFLHASLYADKGMEPAASITDPLLRSVVGFDPQGSRPHMLAHEIAHAWWGDLVWPDHAGGTWWLESMTEATAIAGLEAAFGREAADRQRTTDTIIYRIFRAQGRPDYQYGLTPTEQERNADYYGMAYFRPGLFYDKVRQQVGNDVFFAAMRRYIGKERFAVRPGRGPVEELLALPGVEALWQRWMLEAHGDEDLGRLTDEQIRQLGIRK